jgi:FKBP-type peptidyl-prolyl cis-trans isomerase FkpA
MRQKVFTLILLSTIGLLSCRKTTIQPDIKQFDQTQIDAYISAHGLTAMKRDKTSGDTTGIYYQVINPGDSVDQGKILPAMDYPDKITLVFTIRTLDGKYVQTDTIANHVDDYLGHIVNHKLPLGLQLGLHNNLRYRGGSIRLLIPSHLAYGASGYGSGSTQTTNTRIAGNQSLDVYVHVIGNIPTDNQATYDDQVIRSYMQANSLTDYIKVQSVAYPGNYYYYKILTPGTGTQAVLNDNSSVTATYTGQIFNGTIFDAHNGTDIRTFTLGGLVSPIKESLEKYATPGLKISFLIPSALAYGEFPPTSAIPPYSCLRFTFAIVTP